MDTAAKSNRHHITVVVIYAFELDDHVPLECIIANPLDEAAAV